VEVRADRGAQQTSCESGPVFPGEFRAGLDEYLNKLDGKKTAARGLAAARCRAKLSQAIWPSGRAEPSPSVYSTS